LLSRPFAPAAERLTSLGGRLAAIPDALATARAVLRDVPRIHAETAVGQFAGAAALIRVELPTLLAQEPGLRSAVEPAAMPPSTPSTSSARGCAPWWTAASPAGTAARPPAVGGAALAHAGHRAARRRGAVPGERESRRVGAALREAAAELVGGPPTDETVRRALDSLAAQHPDDSSIVDLAKITMSEATEFVREHGVVTLVDDPCVIEEMPEFARGVAVAYCDPPGPLETADVPTFYCIAPTPADWPPERVESFYREYNNQMIRNLTVHEAMPGHFLQIAHARRFRADTRVRALGWSGPFVEGGRCTPRSAWPASASAGFRSGCSS
jgi:hypothetical protein